MKKFTLFAAFALLFSAFSFAQTARVQIIHNSADAAADSVDVYLDGTLILDNFAFRNATPFIDVDADVQISIDVAPKTSSSASESIYNLTTTLTSGETYVLVASGIVSGSGYTPATAFAIDVFATGRESASVGTNTDLLVYHGSTDAPTVDVYEATGPAELVGDLAYGAFSADYLELPTADYYLQVRDQTGTVNVAAFDAPLATLGLDGAAAVVVASGFLDPSVNSDGPAFGLYVALPTGGEMVALPQSTARVQVIHNSADAAADSVDVYLNDGMLIDNFAFRNASAFIDAPANTEISIDIAPKGSASSGESIYNLTTTLDPTMTYVLVASGIVSGSGYTPATAFAIDVNAMGREEAATGTNTDLLVYHGSTDAPTVDVYEATGPAELVGDLAYGAFSADYLELPTADYYLQVRDQTGTVNVAAFDAPLATLGLDGAAAVVVASGFLDPSVNSDGPAFGLYVALPTGGEMVALPQSTARVQVIHNSADAAADSVDVYLNDGMLIDNFAFRNASAFIDAPANTEISIDIAPKGSASSGESIYNLTTTLDPTMTYVLVASGIVSGSGYTPATAFAIDVYDMGMETAMGDTTAVLVYHGATDAPTVDVVETRIGAGTIVDNISYGEFQGYLNLASDNYTIDVRDETGATTVASYIASTVGLEGEAITLFASGFLDPSVNSDGPAFGLFAARPDGEVIELLSTDVAAYAIFSVDMSYWEATDRFDPLVDSVDIAGDFNEWAANYTKLDMGDNNIYSTTILLEVGSTYQYKYRINNSWADDKSEFPGGGANRIVEILGDTTLATVFFNDEIFTARVQVIHNSADAAADSVDVYLNDGMLIDNFAFRNASGFIDAPANQEISIDIAPKGSASSAESIFNLTTTLDWNATYVLVANGIVSASGYDPATAFNIYVEAMGREEAANSANTDLLVFHGSTDAPTVDIYESTGPAELINDLAYGAFADYLELPTADYIIGVRDETGSTVVARYEAPLETLQLDSAAITVVASGFLTPANNSDGPAFGLWVALASGGEMVELPVSDYTSVENLSSNNAITNVYPNPASDEINIDLANDYNGSINVTIIGITGQTVLTRDYTSSGSTLNLRLDNLEPGMYILQINGEEGLSETIRFSKM